MGHPSVYPTGATLYDPQRAWSGYTVFQATERGAILVDMNGNVVREWPELHGFPNKILPGGAILGHSGERDPALRHAGYARSDPGGLGRQYHLEI
jgi:hypothetical protein